MTASAPALQALHHITMITGHAQRTVDFYADTLGLRMIKQTVNFDAPEMYHIYFSDELGTPGTVLTWFEFHGASPGRPGAGMVHRIDLAVDSAAALDFWEARLGAANVEFDRTDHTLLFSDPDGLDLALIVNTDNAPLRARHPDVPEEHAIAGVRAVRAYAAGHDVSIAPELIERFGFVALDAPGEYELRGDERVTGWTYDPAPALAGMQAAGTVHHIAWASRDDEHEHWRVQAQESGFGGVPVYNRDYFRSIYFREPSGVLFEIATLSPGFAIDEPLEHLGEELRIPPMHEHLRDEIVARLTPLSNPRVTAGAAG
jgi:glyoxalase family protein